VIREPAVKKVLYWCDQCNVPLIGRTCACGAKVREIPLLQPYDVRPALAADMALIRSLLTEQFGDIPLQKVVLLNKTGGADRADLVIVHGDRFGWLSFDPVARKFSLDVTPEALPHILPYATRGIVDLEAEPAVRAHKGRIGGKRFPLTASVPDGTVIVSYRNRFGTGVVRDGQVRVKELAPVSPRARPDPDWDTVIEKNRYHLKNLERNAIRTIRKHINDRPCANVSFSAARTAPPSSTSPERPEWRRRSSSTPGSNSPKRWSSWRLRGSRSSGQAGTSTRRSRRQVRRGRTTAGVASS
jgi:cysteine desulfurase/selenocysteine lyase